ncbi:LytTR family DNA-binding domain-containing protein [Ureibacillus acetophenoni]|uniref:LytTR family transcriptional regulator n=1 Tax=Ureibacillus acetophenoni TaxID=614649 RepID=A0A285UKA0_9BACL|nr:LytTR family DNA-binding domain-containing protein [Ureibacillus acetophenoni]SOC41808.1 LytTR family transcriptional regulator [Ureibacillus acetophenoni]
MKIELSIDPTCKEPKILIITNEVTDEITELMRILSPDSLDRVSAYTHRGVKIVEIQNIIRIYTENKKVLIQTANGVAEVKLRLYKLEEKLNPKQFVRISNSEIVNINEITNMDISKTGTIGVTLSGNIHTYASRRYVSKIKKQLGL